METPAKVAPVAVDKDNVVFFEITNAQTSRETTNWRSVSANKDIEIAEAGASIERVVDSVRPIADKIVDGLRNAPSPYKPKSVEIHFGVKLSGEVGFFVAKSSGEASILLKLSWEIS